MPTVAPPRKRKAPSPKTEEPVVVPDDGLGVGLGMIVPGMDDPLRSVWP